jgi:hypothetical protein
VLLMKQQAVLRRQFGGARFRIIFIDAAQRFQNITAWFREVRGDLYELPSSVRQTVGRQDRVSCAISPGLLPLAPPISSRES